MEFLRACAARLDDGAPASDVMRDLRSQYTTLPCLSSKLSLVRSLCRPSPDFVAAVDAACDGVEDADEREALRVAALAGSKLPPGLRCHAVDFPPRLSSNARALRLTMEEKRECKRVAARRAVLKNRARVEVDGATLLAHARAVIARPAAARGGIPELALALMLATGRRECELLNGRSVLTVEADHALRFTGQAKKRDEAFDERESRVVPCLAPAAQVVACLAVLRARQRGAILENAAASLRYQSSLSRHMATASPWSGARARVHALRGVYTCMCLRLFDWAPMSDAYVAMCILGHGGITESLVYTPFALGDAFARESALGRGRLTEPLEEPARAEPSLSAHPPGDAPTPASGPESPCAPSHCDERWAGPCRSCPSVTPRAGPPPPTCAPTGTEGSRWCSYDAHRIHGVSG